MNHPDLLEVTDLVVRYQRIVAVQAVTMRVGRGEIVAVLGANGAGKSSLLNSIVGLVPVASGVVRFKGSEIQHLPPERIVRLGIALTPEGRRVFPRLSVADNLRLGAFGQTERGSLADARKRVHELFPILAHRRRQAAGTLSGGEQQMLAIGRSLMAAPELLLLDEPSLGLAPKIVKQIFALIEQLREKGMTILLVEQNVHQALLIADRAYVLVNGRVDRESPAAALRTSGDLERTYLGIGVE